MGVKTKSYKFKCPYKFIGGKPCGQTVETEVRQSIAPTCAVGHRIVYMDPLTPGWKADPLPSRSAKRQAADDDEWE